VTASWRLLAAGCALTALGATACSGGGAPAAGGPSASPEAPRAKASAQPSAQASATPASTEPAPVAAGPRRPSGRPVRLAFAGDANFQGPSAAALGNGLGTVAPLLSDADLTVVNLETAVTTRGTRAAKQFAFRTPPRVFGALARGGVDVVTMANNHGLDYGPVGLRDSLAGAREAGFPVAGIGADQDAAFAPVVRTVNGQRIAVIGATQVLDDNLAASWTAGPGKPGLASAKDEPRLLQEVRAARARADTVVVYLHWGQERRSCPLEVQRSLAAALVAAGADVIVGTHAHVLLGGGYLDGAYVDYGLGNFIFAAHSALGAQSGVLTLTVRGRSVSDARWHPASIRAGQPAPLSGSAAERAGSSWQRLRSCTGLEATAD